MDVATGILDLKSLDMAGLMDFVNSVGNAFYKLGEALQDCDPFVSEAGSDAAFKKLLHMHMILSNPDNLVAVQGKNLYVNGNNILPDLFSAEREFEEGEWGNAGYFLGEAAKRSLAGEQSFHQLEKAYSATQLLGGEKSLVTAGDELESVEFTF